MGDGHHDEYITAVSSRSRPIDPIVSGMGTTRLGVMVAVGVFAGVLGVAAPASAHPGSHGRGGEHTNRYAAQGCQQGGHEARVEAETGRTFASAGDCTSHTALGGAMTAGPGSITLTATQPYGCQAPEGRCWGMPRPG